MSQLFPDAAAPKTKKAPQGPQPEAIRLWEETWARTRGGRFVWTAKDAALIAKARAMAQEDMGVLTQRIQRLLDESEDEWVARNASPGLLVERWNQLAYQPPPKRPKVAPLPEYKPLRSREEYDRMCRAHQERFERFRRYTHLMQEDEPF